MHTVSNFQVLYRKDNIKILINHVMFHIYFLMDRLATASFILIKAELDSWK